MDPQSLYQVSTSISVADDQPVYPPLGEKRKGIVFDESPLGDYSIYNQQNPYIEDSSGSGGFQGSYADPSSSEQSSPFYQNYATTESPNYQAPPAPAYSGNKNVYSGAGQRYPNRQYSQNPGRYPSQYSYPQKYTTKYPSNYPSNYYQSGNPNYAASTNYPNYYPPNRYAASPGQKYYYNPQTGSYYPNQAQYQRPTAAQQHASLYKPNTQSPYPYYQPNYAQQFGNYRPSSSRPSSGGISGFFNNIQNGNFGGQFGKAIEDITANDDLLCVPKLLCQMIGNPRRQTQLPSFLTSPAIMG